MSYVQPDFDLFVRDFSPGYLETPESDSLPGGATPDAKNAFFDRIGLEATRRATFRKRPGSRLINPTAMSLGDRVDLLAEFTRVPPGTNSLVAVCNGFGYLYDGTTGFGLISGLSGFIADSNINRLIFKDILYVTDGTTLLRYNGTAGLPVGFVAPTGAPTLTVGAATGVTGTYVGFAVWYDSATDHESSPSVLTAEVAFANQKRTWAKPTGSPPANVDFWRVYARRVDTSETEFFRVATVAIATGSVVEIISDAARRDVGPHDNVNDAPTAAWNVLGAWKGYGFGLEGDDMHVSRLGDFESWHPKDVIKIVSGGRDGRVFRNFGTEALVQTPTKTFHLVGDRMPFILEELHSTFGCVAQKACGEVNNYFYAWDEKYGPYRTDTSNWQRLAETSIKNVVSSVNKGALDKIRFGHSSVNHLVFWGVPTGTSSRLRTILAFDYILERWLPPITGLEWSEFTEFTTSAGALGLYAGDQWGRVYEMFTGLREGVPSGTVVTQVTSATPSTVTCAGASVGSSLWGAFNWGVGRWSAGLAAFYTTGDDLTGMPVAVCSPAGVWQWRTIASNTATVITIDIVNGSPWTTVPEDGWLCIVGGIEWFWTIPWIDFDLPDLTKRGGWLMVQGKSSSEGATLDIGLAFNDNPSAVTRKDIMLGSTGSGSNWGAFNWGVGVWGATPERRVAKRRIRHSFLTMRFTLRNYQPDELVQITSYRVGADKLPRRKAYRAA